MLENGVFISFILGRERMSKYIADTDTSSPFYQYQPPPRRGPQCGVAVRCDFNRIITWHLAILPPKTGDRAREHSETPHEIGNRAVQRAKILYRASFASPRSTIVQSCRCTGRSVHRFYCSRLVLYLVSSHQQTLMQCRCKTRYNWSFTV